MDKLSLSLIGVGAIGICQLLNSNKGKNYDRQASQQTEVVQPGILLNDFVSNKYRISFKYPRSWSKNPRYDDKYEGESGFFEVGDFTGVGENIDEAIQNEIKEDNQPYGSNPIIRSFVVDGEPARVIYASPDQSSFYTDRSTAIVVKYPTPLIVDNQKYDYVVIWVSRDYVPLVLSTFKFVNE